MKENEDGLNTFYYIILWLVCFVRAECLKLWRRRVVEVRGEHWTTTPES